MNVIQRRSSSMFSLSLPHFLANPSRSLVSHLRSCSFSPSLSLLLPFSPRYYALSFFHTHTHTHTRSHALCLDGSHFTCSRASLANRPLRQAFAHARTKHSQSTHLNGRSFACNVLFTFFFVFFFRQLAR